MDQLPAVGPERERSGACQRRGNAESEEHDEPVRLRARIPPDFGHSEEQATGERQRETLPDTVFEQADEVELIDLPVEELFKRLSEGKVYHGQQAQLATERFFRRGNLTALREIALRRTAERVDAQMQAYQRDKAIQEV